MDSREKTDILSIELYGVSLFRIHGAQEGQLRWPQGGCDHIVSFERTLTGEWNGKSLGGSLVKN